MRMDGLLCLVFSFLSFLLIEKKRERKGNETDRSYHPLKRQSEKVKTHGIVNFLWLLSLEGM